MNLIKQRTSECDQEMQHYPNRQTHGTARKAADFMCLLHIRYAIYIVFNVSKFSFCSQAPYPAEMEVFTELLHVDAVNSEIFARILF